MSSSDSVTGTTGTEGRLVRTTGLQPTGTEATGDESGTARDTAPTAAETRRLRATVGELERELTRTSAALDEREARIEELSAELESVRGERDDARQWAAFLDRELREHREQVETLEERVAALESGPTLLGRLRRLFGR
jgi:chromosome segregation ATPase